MTKLEKAIRKVIHTCLRLTPDESVLILSDDCNRELGQLLLKTALRVNDGAVLMEIKNCRTGSEPPLTARTFMSQVNALVIATSNFLFHSKSLTAACHQGARIICLSNLTRDSIARCINTDFDFIAEKSQRLADLLSIGKVATLTTQAGTHLTLPIGRRKGHADTGIAAEAGMIAGLPSGEANVTFEKCKAEGIVVIDGSLGPLGLVNEPIRLKVADGHVNKITGGEEAHNLRKTLKPFGAQSRNIVELGIGTNPNAMITGKSIEDEKALGTAHIAMGDPLLERGSDQNKKCHIDAILRNPTIDIDGHQIVRDGTILV